MATVDALIADLNGLLTESNTMRHELGLHADHASLDLEISKVQEDVYDLIKEAKTLIQDLGATKGEIDILTLDVTHEQNVLAQVRARMDRFIAGLRPRVEEEEEDEEPESLHTSDEEDSPVYDSEDEL